MRNTRNVTLETAETVNRTFLDEGVRKMKSTRNVALGVVLVAAILVLLPGNVKADVATFQDAEDTMLFSSHSDRNHGGRDYVSTYDYTGALGRSLVRFDLSSLNITNLDITAATFSMYAYKKGAAPGNIMVGIHEIMQANADWVEGNGAGTVPIAGASSWDYKKHSTARWAGDTGNDGGADAGCSVAGTDYVGTALASFDVAATGWVDWTFTAAGLDLLEDYADGTKDNAGFYVYQTDGGRYLDYYSSEYTGDASLQPKLVVTYVPEPATMVLLGIGGVGLLIRRRRRA